MLAGELYDPLDPDLVAARERARELWAARSSWPACVAAREQSLAPEALSRAISRRMCSQPEIRVE
jgi:hypothetical protein